MRGDDLQGMDLEELKQLEKMLETGLARVLQSKVTYPSVYFSSFIYLFSSYFPTSLSFFWGKNRLFKIN